MGIGMCHLAAQSMMAEQGAKSGGSHGPSTLAAFQRNEEKGGVGERPFQAQIFFEDLDDFRRQRQNAFLVAFAEDSHLRLGELERQHFARAQTIEQHQADQGEIAKGAKATPEVSDFVCR